MQVADAAVSPFTPPLWFEAEPLVATAATLLAPEFSGPPTLQGSVLG